MIGKRHLELAMKWLPSAATYGTTAGIGIVYLTEWKLIMQNLPFYETFWKAREKE